MASFGEGLRTLIPLYQHIYPGFFLRILRAPWFTEV
jgi:hypothetical protein